MRSLPIWQKFFRPVALSFLALASFGSPESLAVAGTRIKKERQGPPHRPIPDPRLVGDFMYVETSGGWVDQSGNTTPGVNKGVQLKIHPDGTGTGYFEVRTGGPNGVVSTVLITYVLAYEITMINRDHANIRIHVVSGNNYQNGILLHPLDASRVYPNGDMYFSNIAIGVNAQGKSFFTVYGRNPQTFTRM